MWDVKQYSLVSESCSYKHKVPSGNAESSFIFQKVCLLRAGAAWHATKSSYRSRTCVAKLQWYNTYKATNMPSGRSLHISWQANSNLLRSLIYVLTLHGDSQAGKHVFLLLLFDACVHVIGCVISLISMSLVSDTVAFGFRFSQQMQNPLCRFFSSKVLYILS